MNEMHYTSKLALPWLVCTVCVCNVYFLYLCLCIYLCVCAYVRAYVCLCVRVCVCLYLLFVLFRTVRVIRLICKDTIEDGMLRIGQKKLKLEQDMTAAEQGNLTSCPTALWVEHPRQQGLQGNLSSVDDYLGCTLRTWLSGEPS